MRKALAFVLTLALSASLLVGCTGTIVVIENPTGNVESTESVDSSLTSIEALNTGFHELLTSFTSLYQNIEEHDISVGSLSDSFDHIHNSVSDMATYSEKNQSSIYDIADSIKVYGSNVEQMGSDTEVIRQLVLSMEEEISNK